MDAVFPNTSLAAGVEADGVARVVFEYLPGRQFVIQRWEVPNPAAPDGIAIIGWDSGRGSLLQHYFDSRGVARLYEMSFGDGVWKLSRTAADFSPLDFAQRYVGAISDDGCAIRGTWELSTDRSQWENDFELSYSKIARADAEPVNVADLVAAEREIIATNLYLKLLRHGRLGGDGGVTVPGELDDGARRSESRSALVSQPGKPRQRSRGADALARARPHQASPGAPMLRDA